MLWTFSVANRSAAPITVSATTISVGPGRRKRANIRAVTGATPSRAASPPVSPPAMRRSVMPASREHLDLHEARRSRSAGGKPRGDSHALAALTPAELDDAPRRVGDQRLGRLVAAHRCGLH